MAGPLLERCLGRIGTARQLRRTCSRSRPSPARTFSRIDLSTRRIGARMARVLGIDFGTRRIGAAVSDPRRLIATPLEVYERRDPAQDARHYRALVRRARGGPRRRRPAAAYRRARGDLGGPGPLLGGLAGGGDGRPGHVLRRAVHHRRGRGSPHRGRAEAAAGERGSATCSRRRSSSRTSSTPAARPPKPPRLPWPTRSRGTIREHAHRRLRGPGTPRRPTPRRARRAGIRDRAVAGPRRGAGRARHRARDRRRARRRFARRACPPSIACCIASGSTARPGSR